MCRAVERGGGEKKYESWYSGYETEYLKGSWPQSDVKTNEITEREREREGKGKERGKRKEGGECLDGLRGWQLLIIFSFFICKKIQPTQRTPSILKIILRTGANIINSKTF